MNPLEVRDVRVSFGGLRALDAVSLTVAPNSIVGLIGPNGAGKTTLFNVVTGLQPAEGTVTLYGEDVTRQPPHERASRGVRRSFQNLGLMADESVLTNVLAACHVEARYRSAVLPLPGVRQWWRREHELRDRAMSTLKALQLDALSHEKVGDLSFGSARFVELAAVLVGQPRLLLLDEPTTGLDVLEVDRLREVLRQIRDSGRSILVVAHDVRFVMALCDIIYVLAQGRMLRCGRPVEVQSDAAVIEAYLGRAA